MNSLYEGFAVLILVFGLLLDADFCDVHTVCYAVPSSNSVDRDYRGT